MCAFKTLNVGKPSFRSPKPLSPIQLCMVFSQVWVDWRPAVRDGLRLRGIARSRKVEEIIGALWESETQVLDAVEIIAAQGL